MLYFSSIRRKGLSEGKENKSDICVIISRRLPGDKLHCSALGGEQVRLNKRNAAGFTVHSLHVIRVLPLAQIWKN